MASRLFDAVRAHFSRHKHSMVGALQLRRDLGEFEAWVRRNAVSEFQRERWREEAAACGALAVPAATLPRLLMEREAEAEAVGGRRGRRPLSRTSCASCGSGRTTNQRC